MTAADARSGIGKLYVDAKDRDLQRARTCAVGGRCQRRPSDLGIVGGVKRQEKADRIGVLLDELYPKPPIPLEHRDPYTLLVAVMSRRPPTRRSTRSRPRCSPRLTRRRRWRRSAPTGSATSSARSGSRRARRGTWRWPPPRSSRPGERCCRTGSSSSRSPGWGTRPPAWSWPGVLVRLPRPCVCTVLVDCARLSARRSRWSTHHSRPCLRAHDVGRVSAPRRPG